MFYVNLCLFYINYIIYVSIQNQRIVELPKKRPSWFHQSLLEPTTEESNSNNKDVNPTHLV